MVPFSLISRYYTFGNIGRSCNEGRGWFFHLFLKGGRNLISMKRHKLFSHSSGKCTQVIYKTILILGLILSFELSIKSTTLLKTKDEYLKWSL
jgi:hypothetical protein